MPRDGVLKGNPTKDRRSRRKPVEGTRLVEYRKKKKRRDGIETAIQTKLSRVKKS